MENHFDTRTRIWISLAFIYLLVRFAFTVQLDSLGTYSSYVFEIVCVLAALILKTQSTPSLFNFPRILTSAYGALIAFIAGFTMFKTAGFFGILVPFDFKQTEALIFLLLVAPFLEELLFRFFLWSPFQLLTKNPKVTLIITSLIFSYSHFHAFWFVDKEIYPFVIFQTTYTFFLGLACGYFVYRYTSIAGAILFHFAFNLGFYLASTPLALMPL